MVNGSVGLSGHNFDAFVSSQSRNYNETDWAAKIQEKYWRARQKFLAKIEKKEDSCIVLSDSKLDSKLQIYKSIDKSCAKLTDILEAYQNSLFLFANEENALGILLKECGKHDKTKAGKIMSITGKSLTQSSHQRIRLYMPLLRLYQEMETFHSRAVNDTAETVSKLETKRAQYRSSLLWMKDISEKLDPDVYRQLDKFRRVQNKVRDDKKAFDGMQMDVVQKIDLLMASRCNLMNQILAPYQTILLETFDKNYKNFKSVEEIIKNEDIYEYEFKALKQLNPLKIEDSPTYHQPSPSDTKQEHEVEQANEANLIGDFDDHENLNTRNNNNKDELLGTKQHDLIDVQETEIDSTLERLDSMNVAEDKENLDLLESLFGNTTPEEIAENLGDNSVQLQKGSKSKDSSRRKYGEDLKALRSNLNANLLDVANDDEEKQIASLLGLSERATTSNNSGGNNNNKRGASNDPLAFLQDDIFSRWAKDDDDDKKATTHSDNSDSLMAESSKNKDNDMTHTNEQKAGKDVDLMDIGSCNMPKEPKDHMDFFA